MLPCLASELGFSNVSSTPLILSSTAVPKLGLEHRALHLPQHEAEEPCVSVRHAHTFSLEHMLSAYNTDCAVPSGCETWVWPSVLPPLVAERLHRPSLTVCVSVTPLVAVMEDLLESKLRAGKLPGLQFVRARFIVR